MIDNATPSRSPRVRPSIRRLVYWLGPVLLVIAAWQIWDAVEAARLTRAIERVFPHGMPTNPDVAFVAGSSRPPGESDAAVFYAAANIAAVGIDFGGPDQRPSYREVASAYRESLLGGGDISAETSAAASSYLARYALPLRLVDEARDLIHSGATPGAENAYQISGLWTISSVAGLQTLVLIHRGETGSAFFSLMARLRLARAFFTRTRMVDAVLASQQIGAAAADTGLLLSRTTVSDVQLMALKSEYTALVGSADLGQVIASDVSRWHGNLESMWSGRRVGSGPFTWLARPVLQHHATALVHVAGDALAAARLSWPERAAAMGQIERGRSFVPEIVRFVGAWRIVPQLQDLTVAMAAGVASARAGAVTLAIEQYRRQYGAAPAQLADLVPLLQQEDLQDPFTGESLKYARTSDAYVVYSIGRDGRDDGGKLLPDLPPGRMPGTLPPPDVGVRVSYR